MKRLLVFILCFGISSQPIFAAGDPTSVQSAEGVVPEVSDEMSPNMRKYVAALITLGIAALGLGIIYLIHNSHMAKDSKTLLPPLRLPPMRSSSKVSIHAPIVSAENPPLPSASEPSVKPSRLQVSPKAKDTIKKDTKVKESQSSASPLPPPPSLNESKGATTSDLPTHVEIEHLAVEKLKQHKLNFIKDLQLMEEAQVIPCKFGEIDPEKVSFSREQIPGRLQTVIQVRLGDNPDQIYSFYYVDKVKEVSDEDGKRKRKKGKIKENFVPAYVNLLKSMPTVKDLRIDAEKDSEQYKQIKQNYFALSLIVSALAIGKPAKSYYDAKVKPKAN